MKYFRKILSIALCIALVLCVMIISPAAFAEKYRTSNSVEYLLPSDSQEIAEDELWCWDRESLSFMFNEILARHGRQFEEGGKMYNYFTTKEWYATTPKVTNQQASDSLTELEWKNYRTIKKVIEDMKAANHPLRKGPDDDLYSWADFAADTGFTLSGFQYVKMPGNQTLPVYSAPSADSWRGAKGKASVSTNGAVWAAGFEDGFMQIYYVLNNGGLRVGYVDGSDIKGKVDLSVHLDFSYAQCEVLKKCSLTDDPLQQYNVITKIPQGSTVTYLTTVVNQNGDVWDYIETTFNGTQVRGYVPAGSIQLPEDEING